MRKAWRVKVKTVSVKQGLENWNLQRLNNQITATKFQILFSATLFFVKYITTLLIPSKKLQQLEMWL